MPTIHILDRLILPIPKRIPQYITLLNMNKQHIKTVLVIVNSKLIGTTGPQSKV